MCWELRAVDESLGIVDFGHYGEHVPTEGRSHGGVLAEVGVSSAVGHEVIVLMNATEVEVLDDFCDVLNKGFQVLEFHGCEESSHSLELSDYQIVHAELMSVDLRVEALIVADHETSEGLHSID